MSMSPFRFVHAANVRLDQPMWGLGTVNGEARRLAEEATNLAFEQIVETCIEHDAAFLLLTGNTIDATHGHRGRMLLEQACERLAEYDCHVFIIAGETDPPHTWTSGLPLPANTTAFITPNAQPVPVRRDGEALATIEPYQDRQNASIVPGANGLRIGLIGGNQLSELQKALAKDADGQLDLQHLNEFPNLVDFGYLALGSGSERVTVQLPRGLAHDPGCPQPLDGRETASLGCTLIEVDHAGQLQTRLIPTPIVRREEIDLQLTPGMDWDALVDAMKTALDDRDLLPTEKLWLIRWVIDGEGDLVDSLIEPSAQKELAELVEEELTDDQELLRVHEVEVKARWSDAIDITEAGSVFEEFNALIDEHAAEHLTQFRRGLPRPGLAGGGMGAAHHRYGRTIDNEERHHPRPQPCPPASVVIEVSTHAPSPKVSTLGLTNAHRHRQRIDV